MAMDLTQPPYFDDYDSRKFFTKIVGVAGRVAQVREFTQAQDIQTDFLTRLGSEVFKNGKVLRGCTVRVKPNDGMATITNGRVFLDGLVRDVEEQSVAITGRGTETLGLKITPELVTEVQDGSLRDNAEGYRNFDNAGAHRIREEPKWVVNDPESVVVYTLVDAQQVAVPEDDETTAKIVEMLARRTYDENGSYKVSGLKLTDRREHDDGNVYVSVQAGKAYVGGYEVSKTQASRLAVRKGLDTQVQYNETNTFVPPVSYRIANPPVKTVDAVDCTVRKTVKLTRSDVGGGMEKIDDPREGSILNIVRVWAGNVEYKQGTDFLFHDDGISWELTVGAKEPESGTQYQVTYDFRQRMLPTEYEVTHTNIGHTKVLYMMERGSDSDVDPIPVPHRTRVVKVERVYKDSDTSYAVGTDCKFVDELDSYGIDWSGSENAPGTGDPYVVELTILTSVEDPDNDYLAFRDMDFPINDGSDFTVDYTYYLGRRDLVTMAPNGACAVVEGTPNILRRACAPENSDGRVLPIGVVTVHPNSNDVDVESFQNYRLDQSQLYNMRQRLDNLEYNVAMSDLDKEAMEGEPPTQLKGVFTDGFIGPTKCDVTHTDFDCSFDFDYGYLLLPQNEGIVGMKPDSGNTNAHLNGGIASAPFTNEVMVEQRAATEDFLVNPYAVYDNLAIVELDPYVDNWVDSTRLTVDGGTDYETRYEDVNGGTTYVNAGTTRRRETRGGIFRDYDVTSYSYGAASTNTTTSSRDDTTTRTQTDVVLDEAITYMRPITVNVRGSNFTINADNLIGYFDDREVKLSPGIGYESGTRAGSMRADADGKFEASFVIPEGVPCGAVQFRVENEANHGGTNFSAQGRREVIQDTVFRTVTTTVTRTTHTTVPRYTTITTIHDPLAQSFYVEDDAVLTQIGLFFREKDESKNVIVEVRDLVNGLPGAEAYLQQVVYAKDVKVSDEGTEETVVDLEQPLYLEGGKSYCFVVISDSNKYRMWTAKVGGIDEHSFDERYQVVTNPYAEGVMFSSSNAQTWTEHQDQDLKFRLYRARFTGPGTVVYPEAVLDRATALILAAQTVDYANQGIRWYYQVGSSDRRESALWLPIETFNYWDLGREVQRVSLKCVLECQSDNISPFLNAESVNLVYYNNENSGAYVSRQVVMEQDFNTLQVSVEAHTTGKTSFKVLYSLTDDDAEWVEMKDPDDRQLDQYFTRHTFTASMPALTRKVRLKIELSSTDRLDSPVIRKLLAIMKSV